MKKYKIKNRIPYKEMQEAEKNKATVNKYEFGIKYFEKKNASSNYCKIYHLESLLNEYINEKVPLEALKRNYTFEKDKRIFDISAILDKVFYFFERNTNLTKDVVKDVINSNIFSVEIYKNFKEKSGGTGYYNGILKELAIRGDCIDDESLEHLLRHEFTHLLGTNMKKNELISGYSRELLPSSDTNNTGIIKYSPKSILRRIKQFFYRNEPEEKKNEQFNEACVEMFASKEEEFKEMDMSEICDIDVKLYTNLVNPSSYMFNANLVRQMIIANGISENELFYGLFDEKKSNKFIKKFNKNVFKRISKGMEEVYQALNNYLDISNELYHRYRSENDQIHYRKQCLPKEFEEENAALSSFKGKISDVEKTIIDNILLHKLEKINAKDKEKLLSNYSKFIMIEKEYFEKKTGFKIMSTSSNESNEKNFIESLKFNDIQIQNPTKLIEKEQIKEHKRDERID